MPQCLLKIPVAAIIAALLLPAAAPANLRAAGIIAAIVVYVEGEVNIRWAGEKDFLPAKVNALLYTGDALQTGPRSTASVALRFGSEVRVNENSILEILSGTGRGDFVGLGSGQVWTRMLHKRARLDVQSPAAVCAIRGTEADIEQRNLLTVKVYEGHVYVRNSIGKQSLAAGQMGTVSGAGAAPAAPKKMDAGDMGNWQEAIDAGNIRQSLNKLRSAADVKKLKFKVIKDGKSRDIVVKTRKK